MKHDPGHNVDREIVATKLKFSEESKVRSWVVPIELDFCVISFPLNPDPVLGWRSAVWPRH